MTLLQALIRFDTTTHVPGAPARDEAALQAYLAERLLRAGASVDVSAPDPSLIAAHRMVPEGFTFSGRPQLVARFAGTGGGRTLLLNGHVDVIDAEPQDAWDHPPFAGLVVDDTVRGRGACDMKGGVACMVFAAEVLAEMGVRLAGDLLVNTVTEEESTGAGGLVSARTLRADGAIVPEPTGLDVWPACRGSLLPTITVEGRAGHAGLPPGDPGDGGAVNAIEKMAIVLEAIRRLREHWALRYRHRYLSPPDCVPTIVSGGEWRLLSGQLPARVPLSTCPSRPTTRAGDRWSSTSSRTGSARGGRRPVAGCPSTADRVAARGSSAGRGLRRRADRRRRAGGRARGGSSRRGRRPRQLARRRHADGGGGNPGRVPRTGSVVGGPHCLRTRADRRSVGLRTGTCRRGPALLWPGRRGCSGGPEDSLSATEGGRHPEAMQSPSGRTHCVAPGPVLRWM